MNQFNEALKGDDLIAVAGMRVKSMPEEVLSLPLVVDPSYPVTDGAVIYLTDDKKGCTTTRNATAGYVGAVVLNQVGKSGNANNYIKGDVVPVMVKGKLYVPVKSAVTDLSATVGADTNGVFSTTDTPVNGVRFGGLSVGSKNLTVIELLGV